MVNNIYVLIVAYKGSLDIKIMVDRHRYNPFTSRISGLKKKLNDRKPINIAYSIQMKHIYEMNYSSQSFFITFIKVNTFW